MDPLFFYPLSAFILWAASFLYFRWYLSRRSSAQAILRDFRDEVDKLVSEIDSATDRDSALVEERIRALRALLEDADKRIALYTREMDKRKAEEKAYADLGRRRPLSAAVPAPSAAPADAPRSGENLPVKDNIVAQDSHAVQGNLRVQESVPAAPAELNPPPLFVRSAKEIPPAPMSFAERVAELHRSGFAADLIAKRLGATVAEVDLAIALASRMEARDNDGNRN